MNFKSNKSNVNYFNAFLLVFVLAIIPFIIKVAVVQYPEIELSILRSSTKPQLVDFFSYYKSIAIMIAGGLLFFSVASSAITDPNFKWVKLNKLFYVFVGVYVFMVILSTIFSKYKYTSMHGLTGRFESIWVLLSYMVFLFAATQFTSSKEALKFIVGGVFLSAFLVGSLGALQFFGLDYMNSEYIRNLVAGKHTIKSYTIFFTSSYSTLTNPNSLGLYSAMISPFFVVLAVMMPIKSKFKYISVAFVILMLFNLLGSNSLAGKLGFSASIFVLFIVWEIYCFYNKKHTKITIISAVVLVVAIISSIFAVAINDNLNAKFKRGFGLTDETIYFYKDLKLEDNIATFYTEKGEFSIEYLPTEQKFNGYDYNGNLCNPTPLENEIEGVYKFGLKGMGRGESLELYLQEKFIMLEDSEESFLFGINENNELALCNRKGVILDSNEKTKSFLFNGYENLATGRGYLWSRSIPIAIKHTFLGSGPDTFAFEFPQDEVIWNVKIFGNPYTLADKPHNLYIQQAINTSVVSLIALLGLFGLYLYETVKKIFKKDRDDYFVFVTNIAIFAAIVGYLVSALSTDSIVAVAPVFWVLLGTGFAVNRL